MEIPATVTSKGQVTIPARVRRALDLTAGTRIVFRLEGDSVTVEHRASKRMASVERLPDFFALAGSVAVPDELRGVEWGEIRRRAWNVNTRRGPS